MVTASYYVMQTPSSSETKSIQQSQHSPASIGQLSSFILANGAQSTNENPNLPLAAAQGQPAAAAAAAASALVNGDSLQDNDEDADRSVIGRYGTTLLDSITQFANDSITSASSNNNYQQQPLDSQANSSYLIPLVNYVEASLNATATQLNASQVGANITLSPTQPPITSQAQSRWILLLFALLVLINLIVILGNILVILAVYATAKLRNVTNIFTVSLAIADLLLGLFVLPYAVMFEVLDVWVFGNLWCRGWLVADVWISTASILNLCAISVDRYVAVTRPVKYRSIMTARLAKSIVAGVWIVSFLICCPPLLPQWDSISSSSSSSRINIAPFNVSSVGSQLDHRVHNFIEPRDLSSIKDEPPSQVIGNNYNNIDEPKSNPLAAVARDQRRRRVKRSFFYDTSTATTTTQLHVPNAAKRTNQQAKNTAKEPDQGERDKEDDDTINLGLQVGQRIVRLEAPGVQVHCDCQLDYDRSSQQDHIRRLPPFTMPVNVSCHMPDTSSENRTLKPILFVFTINANDGESAPVNKSTNDDHNDNFGDNGCMCYQHNFTHNENQLAIFEDLQPELGPQRQESAAASFIDSTWPIVNDSTFDNDATTTTFVCTETSKMNESARHNNNEAAARKCSLRLNVAETMKTGGSLNAVLVRSSFKCRPANINSRSCNEDSDDATKCKSATAAAAAANKANSLEPTTLTSSIGEARRQMLNLSSSDGAALGRILSHEFTIKITRTTKSTNDDKHSRDPLRVGMHNDDITQQQPRELLHNNNNNKIEYLASAPSLSQATTSPSVVVHSDFNNGKKFNNNKGQQINGQQQFHSVASKQDATSLQSGASKMDGLGNGHIKAAVEIDSVAGRRFAPARALGGHKQSLGAPTTTTTTTTIATATSGGINFELGGGWQHDTDHHRSFIGHERARGAKSLRAPRGAGQLSRADELARQFTTHGDLSSNSQQQYHQSASQGASILNHNSQPGVRGPSAILLDDKVQGAKAERASLAWQSADLGLLQATSVEREAPREAGVDVGRRSRASQLTGNDTTGKMFSRAMTNRAATGLVWSASGQAGYRDKGARWRRRRRLRLRRSVSAPQNDYDTNSLIDKIPSFTPTPDKSIELAQVKLKTRLPKATATRAYEPLENTARESLNKTMLLRRLTRWTSHDHEQEQEAATTTTPKLQEQQQQQQMPVVVGPTTTNEYRTSYTRKSGCALYDHKSYVIYSALGSFYIPMLIMIFFYSRIYLVASRAQKNIKRGYMTTKWPPGSHHANASAKSCKSASTRSALTESGLAGVAANGDQQTGDNQLNSGNAGGETGLNNSTLTPGDGQQQPASVKKRGVLGGSFRAVTGRSSNKNVNPYVDGDYENFERVTLRIHRRQQSSPPPESKANHDGAATALGGSSANVNEAQASTPTQSHSFGPDSELIKLANIFKREQQQAFQLQQVTKDQQPTGDEANQAVEPTDKVAEQTENDTKNLDEEIQAAPCTIEHASPTGNNLTMSTRLLRRQSAIEREQSSEAINPSSLDVKDSKDDQDCAPETQINHDKPGKQKCTTRRLSIQTIDDSVTEPLSTTTDNFTQSQTTINSTSTTNQEPGKSRARRRESDHHHHCHHHHRHHGHARRRAHSRHQNELRNRETSASSGKSHEDNPDDNGDANHQRNTSRTNRRRARHNETTSNHEDDHKPHNHSHNHHHHHHNHRRHHRHSEIQGTNEDQSAAGQVKRPTRQRLTRQRHSVAGHETGSNMMQDECDHGAAKQKNPKNNRAARKKSLADVSRLINCSSIAEEGSAISATNDNSSAVGSVNVLPNDASTKTTDCVHITVSLAQAASRQDLSQQQQPVDEYSDLEAASMNLSINIDAEGNDETPSACVSRQEASAVPPHFEAITPPPGERIAQNRSSMFATIDNELDNMMIAKCNTSESEAGGLLLGTSRIDRSQSCAPGTPTIVVNWSPASAVESQLVAISSHFAHSESAVASAAGCCEGVGNAGEIMGEDDVSGGGSGARGRKWSRKWTTTNSDSLGSGLGLFPNQVRKQSIMLLNTLTARGSQTLRRLSMVAQHPLDSLLRRSRSHDPKEERQCETGDSNVDSRGHTGSAAPNIAGGAKSRRKKRRRHAKTLDDYLMAVAGIDSSSSSSDLSSQSSLSMNSLRLSRDDAGDDEDEDLGPDEYYYSNEDDSDGPMSTGKSLKGLPGAINHRGASHWHTGSGELSDGVHDINADYYPDKKTCNLTTLLHKEKIRLPPQKLIRDPLKVKRSSEALTETGISKTKNQQEDNIDDPKKPDICILVDGVGDIKDEQTVNAGPKDGQESCKTVDSGQQNPHNTLSNGPSDSKPVLVTSDTSNGKVENVIVKNGAGQQTKINQQQQHNSIEAIKKVIPRRRGKRTSRWHARRLRAETKAAKTVAIIIGGFISCWLPFFTAYLGRAVVCSTPDCVPQSLLSLFIWLGYLNSAINPVIYGLVSADFRQAFKNIICRCSFKNPRKDDSAVVSALVDNIIKSIL